VLGLANVLLTPHVVGGVRTNLTRDVESVVLKIWDGINKTDRDRDTKGITGRSPLQLI
jgi:hypothetical protein